MGRSSVRLLLLFGVVALASCPLALAKRQVGHADYRDLETAIDVRADWLILLFKFARRCPIWWPDQATSVLTAPCP